jgi:bifunctional oligoribonuclease and PAP phosphatase NrnA
MERTTRGSGEPKLVADPFTVTPERRTSIERLARELRAGRSIAISTHINADGDGCGSEIALSYLLLQMGLSPRIVNPTPWPEMYDFLLTPEIPELSVRGAAALNEADVITVVDISDVKRLGVLSEAVRAAKVPRLVIDHHIPSDEPPGEVIFSDVTAAATAELIFDFATVLGLEITPQIALALYVAILTDTGGFRFSNTTPRSHFIAARLLATGVDPEETFRRIYASVPVGRLHLLRDALATLEVDPEYGISWVTVTAGSVEQYGLKSEDLDGIADHPRSIAGTRLAMVFRELSHGKVKISFRSVGDIDVNKLAREFGGGGHAKAAGALVTGELDEVRHNVLGAARRLITASDERAKVTARR